MNQKLVPGVPHWPVTRPPGPVCSTASPWAIDPPAVTSTPPRPGSVLTAGLEPGRPAFCALLSSAAEGTPVICRMPGLVSVTSACPEAAPPAGDSAVTATEPAAAAEADPGTAATATEPPVGLPEPGAAHMRVAADTGTFAVRAACPAAVA